MVIYIETINQLLILKGMNWKTGYVEFEGPKNRIYACTLQQYIEFRRNRLGLL